MGSFSIRADKSDTALYSLRLAIDGAMKAAMKLSSGNRINSAADDPAGLVISERMRDRIATLRQECSNITQVVNKYATVDSAMLGMREQLVELRSLAVGAANAATNSSESQQAYATAAKSIVETYNRTIESSQYNGKHTLDGSEGAVADVGKLSGIDLSSGQGATASLTLIDDAAHELDMAMVDLGAKQRNELESQRAANEIEIQNLTAAESQIRDTDYATEYSRYVANMIKTYTSMAMVSHSLISAKTVLSLVR